MATYLLTWNPARWPWDNLAEQIAECKREGHVDDSWSCGGTRKIVTGDRVFLMRQGQGKRGIMASGWATSDVWEDRHWDAAKRRQGLTTHHVDVRWDVLLDPDDVFPRDALRVGIYTRMFWDPLASGTTISDDVAAQLEADWARYIGGNSTAV
jgi:hypothetical protein